MNQRPAVLVFSFAAMMITSSWVAGADDDEVMIADPERLTLQTKDGVELHCTWYAGGVTRNREGQLRKIDGKKVVPIIMIHGWEGRRTDFSAIASYLQLQGHAVIVPDLRGHGESTGITGSDRDIELDRLTKVDLARMVEFDIEACKKFLMQKNNDGELNIELLCVAGAEEGAILATNWVLRDWSWPDLINRKQGKDVKCLILISPERTFKGYHLNQALQQPLLSGRGAPFIMPVMIIVGERDSAAYREAKTINSRLEGSRPKTPRDASREERLEKQTLFFVGRDSAIQGAKLLLPRYKFGLERQISGLINLKLSSKADEFEWTDRSN